ncbi:[LSU ribosomal protein L11P]-lysine N-methyltransferase [Sphaerotilus hippei]|uniref:Ribosomal protein L11 methyltransferase n=1 Tax=Sphaerotilus hippei TaxID=744406 RepID=A0A318GWE0_9BURK|nr:50S ribosomal protein L11 methyltransferase [Sphaerotilus hippei]PXW93874.1 [LSU ribosomal protein L11P]-lysine N-methyltransferase [Sphaerotilus hippei]
MVELTLFAPASQVDELSDALMELDALSVTVEDANADTPDEAPIFGEPGMPAAFAEQIRGWQHSVLKALFAHEEAATSAATLLLSQEIDGLHVQAMEPVVEQDWVRLTQSQFAPVPITEQFWIVPSWHEPPAGATQVMRLDPGLAFGTGTHPTTRMCLRWIAHHASEIPAWPRTLDYGCGSGILAIGVGLFGGRHIDAVDIDPAAVESTLANARVNGVTVNVGLPDLASGTYPLVLANILAAPLKLLAPLLSQHVAPGGHLVLAGILERQIDELKAAYAPWLTLEVADQEDGWVLLSAHRP